MARAAMSMTEPRLPGGRSRAAIAASCRRRADRAVDGRTTAGTASRAAPPPPAAAIHSPARSLLTPPPSAAACSVLRSSIAIVIGPTPPGTGVIAPARSHRRVEVDVADEAVVGAVDADVDHDRARLDPVALDHPVAADGGDQHVGAAADLGEVARARVADRDGRVGAEQQRGHRLADEVRAADDDGLGALELRRRAAASSSITPDRRARPQARAARARAGRRRSASARRRPCRRRSSPVSSTPSRWSGIGSWQQDPADGAGRR